MPLTFFSRRSRCALQVVAMALFVNSALTGGVFSAGATQPIRLVAFGDSLTAGYGLPRGEDFATRLGQALKQRGHAVEIVNAGVSGDTSADGLARLDWSIPGNADAVILELGANDGLRGLDPKVMAANLNAIVTRLKARHAMVLVAGMRAISNWGLNYAKAYDVVFPELAARQDVALYPFFLEGVALDPALNQPDGLHPNKKGVAEIVARILPAVEALVAKAESQRIAAVRKGARD